MSDQNAHNPIAQAQDSIYVERQTDVTFLSPELDESTADRNDDPGDPTAGDDPYRFDDLGGSMDIPLFRD